MKRRLWILTTLAAMTVCGAAAWWMWLVPRSAINKQAFDQIEIGMNLTEVEALLTGPARDETTGPVLARLSQGEAAMAELEETSYDDFARAKIFRHEANVNWVEYDPPQPSLKQWKSNDAIVSIHFDRESWTVLRKDFLSVYRKYEGPWAVLQRLLKL
jgi:hypothetical protein